MNGLERLIALLVVFGFSALALWITNKTGGSK